MHDNLNDYLNDAAKEMSSVEDEVRTIYKQQVKYFKMLFDELIAAGFNEEQAIQIVVVAAGKTE